MAIVHTAPGANNYSVFSDDGFCAVVFLPSVLTFRGRRSEQSDSTLCPAQAYTVLCLLIPLFFLSSY